MQPSQSVSDESNDMGAENELLDVLGVVALIVSGVIIACWFFTWLIDRL